jgi:hypothetical protein
MKSTIKSLCAALLVASAVSASPVSAKTVAVSLFPYNFVGEAAATKSAKPNKHVGVRAKHRGRLKKASRVKRGSGPSSVGPLTTILTTGIVTPATLDQILVGGGIEDPTPTGGGQGAGPMIDDLPPAPVPLPGAAGLMLVGLMALGAATKARRA